MSHALSAPNEVILAVTNSCNISCEHCSVSSTRASREDLTTDEWLALIEELAEFKVFRVRFTGGEVFMRKDCFALFDAVEAKPMRFSFNTNANLIDEARARRLAQYTKLDEIMISLEGASATSHDRLRGAGNFEVALKGLRASKALGLPVSVYTTVTKYNFQELEEIVQFVLREGLGSVKLNEVIPVGSGLHNWSKLRLSLDERRFAVDRCQKLADQYRGAVSGTLVDLKGIFEKFEADNGLTAEKNFLSGCGASLKDCAVRPDGWVIPCDRLWELKAGNVREEPFGEIWRSSPVLQSFRERFTTPVATLSTCTQCEYNTTCRGGCPAVAFALEGTTLARDPLACYKIYSGEEVYHG